MFVTIFIENSFSKLVDVFDKKKTKIFIFQNKDILILTTIC